MIETEPDSSLDHPWPGRAVIDCVSDLVILLGAEGAVLDMNAAARRALGRRVDGLRGLVIGDLERPGGNAAIADLLEEIEPDREVHTITTLARADGESLDVDCVVRRLDEGGKRIYVISARDASEEKRAVWSFRSLEEWQRSVFDSSADLISIMDFNLRFTYASPSHERILGYDPSWFLGKRPQDLMHPDDRWKVETRAAKFLGRNLKNVLKSRSFFSVDVFEWRMKDRWGKYHDLETTGTITKKGIVVISRDVTARKKMEEEIRKSRNLESLGILAGGIAHDLNNILTVLRGNLSLARMEVEGGTRAVESLGRADRALGRAMELADRFMTFSKGGSPVLVPTRIGELIEQTVSFSLSGSNVVAEYSIVDDLWNVEVDASQMSQVFGNLVINAVQAMPEGGSLRIGAENLSEDMSEALDLRRMRHVVVSIEDTGAGMDPDVRERIFDPYFTTKEKGQGLGLATSHSIVQAHDGIITVDSDRGRGTTFRIYLPATRKVATDIADTDALELSSRPRVLVMEDEEAVGDATARLLDKLGCEEVVVVPDGEATLDVYRDRLEVGSPFDVVVMDVTIPGGMGAEETMEKLLVYDPAARVVVTSGYASSPVLARHAEHGFRAVLKKPFDIAEVARAVRQALD